MYDKTAAQPVLAYPLAHFPQAVLFDMDGVITDTARAHASAWQRLFDDYLQKRARHLGTAFRPFDPHHDYLSYVDGKSRADGVRGFLSSRGIELPEGEQDDGPEQETVHGLGKCKDGYFNDWLDEHRVEIYPGTLSLLAMLRQAGVQVAVFSASRNAEKVLSRAGVLEYFDAKVDGRDLSRLGLPGKPEPTMLIEAARRLKCNPEQCVVIEDAIAGIEAGRRGGFGLLIGVVRGDPEHEQRMKATGADLVVRDLSELHFSRESGLMVKTLANLPAVLACKEEVSNRLAGKGLAVFLDYDGTLTPIVDDHAKALLDEAMRNALARLSRHSPVAIISGRDLKKLQELVDLRTVIYAGSHGFEIAGPDGRVVLQKGSEFLSEVDAAEAELREQLAGIEGHSLERKRFSIAVHYRQVATEREGEVESIVDGVLAEHPRLRRGIGKKVYEIRPDIDWHKGRAVRWILQHFRLDRTDIVPCYVGDDMTDEDAFHALAGKGLSIVVRDSEIRQSAADYTVADPSEVEVLLEWLSTLAVHATTHAGAKR